MPPPDARIAPEDLRACAELLSKGSKSFAMASLVLPRVVRERATVLYAFCRVADDLVDADPHATVETVEKLRERLRLVYAGTPQDDPVDRALTVVMRETRIPFSIPDALLEGMTWDATGRRYETMDELYAYCARVAGTVGVMMTMAMGARGHAVLARACDLGVAMQLTNIARDVGEDARNGRLYLPRAWLADAGVDADAFMKNPGASSQIRAIVARLLEHADTLYARADHGVPMLPASCRTAIRAARLVYADIGRVIAAAGHDSITRRAVVSRGRKVWLLFRALGARFLRLPVLPDPALPANQPLLDACEEVS
jgi:phytoene synthase